MAQINSNIIWVSHVFLIAITFIVFTVFKFIFKTILDFIDTLSCHNLENKRNRFFSEEECIYKRFGYKTMFKNKKNDSSLVYVIIKYGFQRLAEKTKVVDRGE